MICFVLYHTHKDSISFTKAKGTKRWDIYFITKGKFISVTFRVTIVT